MNSEEVLSDLKAEGISDAKCITQHPGFNAVCLQKWSLKLAADWYKTKSKTFWPVVVKVWNSVKTYTIFKTRFIGAVSSNATKNHLLLLKPPCTRV